MKKLWPFVLVALLTIPTFMRMLRPGIYSMQDFHFFRLHQFNKCVVDLQIPCRWSPDSGLGYGEPLFNFYGQLPYAFGTLLHFGGLELVDSLKVTFIFSLVASAIAMFLLAKYLYKNTEAAIVSAILYTYAPYRAVDVWVRGALPEALSFVLFPIIFLFLEKYFYQKRLRDLLLFSFSLALLIMTHNLSVLLFAPVLGIWIIYHIVKGRNKKIIFPLIQAVLLSILISSFYILPVLFESKYVDIASTTLGYFNFRGHFTTSFQLLFSRYWGYGASVFGTEDGMNLSIGIVQWTVAIAAVVIAFASKNAKKFAHVFVLFTIGALCLFLTHERATFIWVFLQDTIKFIQFPWRFLGVALFCLALCAGVIPVIMKRFSKIVVVVVVIGAMALTTRYFREDIWYEYSDNDLTRDPLWEQQMLASIGDFWPKSAGIIPSKQAPNSSADFELLTKQSNKIVYKVRSDKTDIVFPLNDFPGWKKETKDKIVTFTFANTPVRTLGNLLTIFGVGLFAILYIKNGKYEA